MSTSADLSRMDVERERALVARSRSDASAFGELYDFYMPRIHGYVHRRVGDRAVTEDLTAQTFERALVAVRGSAFRNGSFGGWLYRVAGNAVVDHVRRSRRIMPLAGRGFGRPDGPDVDRIDAGAEAADERAVAAFAAAIDRDALRRALLELADAHRRVLVLRFLDDLDPDEICTVLGCSRGTLAVRTHRALRALRGALAKASIDAA
jgi:RNA polymerase sigma-70 factor (ECF subfamily)